MRYSFFYISCFIILSISLGGRSVWAQYGPNCTPVTTKKAIKLVEEAKTKFKGKLYDQAYMLCKEALEVEPEFADPYMLIGQINMIKVERSQFAATPDGLREYNTNLKAAKKHFELVLQFCPDSFSYAYFHLASIYLGEDNYALAENYLTKFLKLNETIPDKDYELAKKMLDNAGFYNKIYANPIPFTPVPVVGISSLTDEYLSFITTDNELAFYTRKVEQPAPKTAWVSADKQYKEKFFMSSLMSENQYSVGEEMPLPFNQNDNEGGPTLTIDNRNLYYTRCKSKFLTKQNKEYYNCDICHSYFDGTFWSDITVLPGNINAIDAWDSQPTISSDGNTLFFVSDRAGGFGGYDIWKITKNKSGQWNTEPENLGPIINTPGDEKSPFIHTDRMTLYFSSADRLDNGIVSKKGHKGVGGYDIFYSKMNENGEWSVPKNIGYPINTAGDEVGFFVSLDGKKGFFNSNKTAEFKGPGGWDLYSFDLPDYAKPENVVMVKGALKEETSDQPIRAKIELVNVKTKQVSMIPVDSVSGVYAVAIVLKKEEDIVMAVKEEGKAIQTKLFSVDDLSTTAIKKADFVMEDIKVGKKYELEDILFGPNSFDLSPTTKVIIDQFVGFLQEHPTMKVAIQGHTDNLWSDQSNMVLSLNRAKAVHDYIIEKGISKNRLTYEGYGESKPIADNATPEGRRQNRRTEFLILSQ